MANGIPSRRRQISTTAYPRSSAPANEKPLRQRTGRARRTGSRLLGTVPSVQGASKGTWPQLLVGDPQTFPAGG